MRRDMGEQETEEGNAFTGALAKAKEDGESSFNVDGKKYSVKEAKEIKPSTYDQDYIARKTAELVLAGIKDVKIELPNSFSPNGDGENDYFRVLTNVDEDGNFANGFDEGGALAEIDLRVFNRYGQQVFRTTDVHEGWDGTLKGKPMNPATYTYILNFRTIDGRSGTRKGNVTLFR
jgi:gliding motility-associated-like protein